MAYMTKGLGKMQVYGKNGEIITLKERTICEMRKYLLRYMTTEEVNSYTYIENSQSVSENNGYTYADFSDKKGNIYHFSVYNNPELG